MLIITEYQQARVLSPLPRGSADGAGVAQQGAPALRRSPDREDLAAAPVARRRGHSRVRPPGHGGAAPLRGGPSGIQSPGARPAALRDQRGAGRDPEGPRPAGRGPASVRRRAIPLAVLSDGELCAPAPIGYGQPAAGPKPHLPPLPGLWLGGRPGWS